MSTTVPSPKERGPESPRASFSGPFDRVAWPRPLFVVTLSLMAGLVAGRCMSLTEWAGPAAVALTLGLYGILQWRHAACIERRPPPRSEILFLAVGALGIWFSTVQVQQEREGERVAAWAGERWTVTVEGRVLESPCPRGIATELRIAKGAILRAGTRSLEAPLPLRVEVREGEVDLVTWREQWRRLVPGDRVEIIGSLEDSGWGYRNPGTGWSRGGMRTGELGPFRVRSRGDVRVIDAGKGRGPWGLFLSGVAKWRDSAGDTLGSAGGSSAGPLLMALVLGDTSDIPPEQYRAFGRAGLLHLFSVSGLHAGVIALALFAVMSCLGLPRRVQMAAVLAGVFVYAALTGFRIPVVRTTIMVAALGMQAWLRRPTDALSRLSLAAFVILLVWPRSLFRPGFQLSFLAVFTLIVFAPWIQETVVFPREKKPGWRGWALGKGPLLARAVVMLTILQLALAPILAEDFHQVSLIAPLANVAAIPLATAALLAGSVLAGPGTWIPGLGVLIGPVAAALGNANVALADTVAIIPGAAIAVAPFPPLALVLYYGVLFGGGYLLFGRGPGDRARRRAAAWIHGAGMVAVVVWLPFLGTRNAERLRVTFLDVGQGDCTLLELPDGGVFVIDAGPLQPEGMARYAIVPVLRDRGVNTIDLALATHADGDHIGGFDDLADAFTIRRFAASPDAGRSPSWEEVEAAMKHEGVIRLYPKADETFRTKISDLRIEILNPDESDLGDGSDRNADSIVMRVKWGAFSVLLTGDADAETERRMIARWEADSLRATVLKAGHHGSDSSTCDEFLNAVHPAVVVFSCGRKNKYGHPDPDVMARCREHGAEIHRTDLHGALLIETDGERMWMSAASENFAER